MEKLFPTKSFSRGKSFSQHTKLFKMCKSCLREAFPERQRTTLERGAYVLNFAGCAQCGQRSDFLSETSKKRVENEDDDDGSYDEEIEYSHACKSCNHIVAQHQYEFRIIMREEATMTTQEYSMTCALCGKGQDSCYVTSSASRSQVRTSQATDSIPTNSFVQEPMSFPTALLATQFATTVKLPPKKDEGDDEEWN